MVFFFLFPTSFGRLVSVGGSRSSLIGVSRVLRRAGVLLFFFLIFLSVSVVFGVFSVFLPGKNNCEGFCCCVFDSRFC